MNDEGQGPPFQLIALKPLVCPQNGLIWRMSEARFGSPAAARMTQGKPTWLVDVSIGSAWRAAGRYPRQYTHSVRRMFEYSQS